MEIRKRLVEKEKKNHPRTPILTVNFITVYYLNSTGVSAEKWAEYLSGGSNGKPESWHYTVDEIGVWQSFENDRACFHAGGVLNTANLESLALKICVQNHNMVKTACRNAVELLVHLLPKHNLSICDIVPAGYWDDDELEEARFGGTGMGFDDFLLLVREKLNKENEEAEQTDAPILSPPTATIEQAEAWARDKYATNEFISLAHMYWQYVGNRGGVNPVVAYAQSAAETAFGKFLGVVTLAHRNPCGMKVSAGGDDANPLSYMRFNSWHDGVKAHIDHLALYAGADSYPRTITCDPRHFHMLSGKANTVRAIGAQWMESDDNAAKILNYMSEIENTTPDTEIEYALDILLERGVISDRDYWAHNYDKLKELDALIINAAREITKPRV
ncbi:MAG: glucosaminidase domain-containing protein [Clostridiales bacterium]|jgi:N-acetylmuramoyl-L-alanine amidase CwlA|nr:glucosaminidase domain-containing protein [Clostridiales bacterium]